jgi:predicted dehydrogenase
MMKGACAAFARRHDWQAWRRHGGGMLANYGAHYVDQLLYICASRAAKVSCSLRTAAALGDADDVVKAVVETESGVILDLDINMCTGIPLPRWMVFGRHGTASLDMTRRAWQVRWFAGDELPARALQEGLAAEGRQYCSEADIPWREEEIPIKGFEPVDFYAKCFAYYAEDAPPFVPISETREVMRTLELCRRDAVSRPSADRSARGD